MCNSTSRTIAHRNFSTENVQWSENYEYKITEKGKGLLALLWSIRIISRTAGKMEMYCNYI